MTMTKKQILLSAFIFGAINSIALGMDNNIEKQNLEEIMFQTNITKLSKPIADFVMDFKTWPKIEQNKIETYHLKYSQGYHINGKPAASDKYNGNIGLYLDCRLTQQQIEPFLDVIDYLKKQQ
jgi:hypothetical protein